MNEAEELIGAWWECVRRMKVRDYADNGEFWALLGRMMELQCDLKALGYTCLEGQWIALAEGN
jgi:hypothetical protein